ncbi:hypothetical protein L596_008990 [Steinernema carpocapsae]|uniref:Core Histone H2A/H2B/H3 domain-containing protein n=1 Tax=Steinernema carpocapsae TaxID=34508 RepID=A0A4U5PE90_STECR|nr:hypothetical protein L596_008990 [Steinernema carpocapsae]
MARTKPTERKGTASKKAAPRKAKTKQYNMMETEEAPLLSKKAAPRKSAPRKSKTKQTSGVISPPEKASEEHTPIASPDTKPSPVQKTPKVSSSKKSDVAQLQSSIRRMKLTKKKRSRGFFKTTILRQLKSLGQESGPYSMSKQGALTVNGLLEDLFERLVVQSVEMATLANRKTLTIADVEAALKLVYPGQLSQMALSAVRKTQHTINSVKSS